MNKKELINQRITQLFGEIGGKMGQYYYDSYYGCVFKVVNQGGGVSRVLTVGKPTQALEILDNILQYQLYMKNKEI